MSWVAIRHLRFGNPGGGAKLIGSVQKQAAFALTSTEFVAWTGLSYIGIRGGASDGNGFGVDILRKDGQILPSSAFGGDLFGKEDDQGTANLRAGARVGDGKEVTFRGRAFGSQFYVNGFGCALPLDQLAGGIRVMHQTVQLHADGSDATMFFLPAHSYLFAWAGITWLQAPNRGFFVAVDIPEVGGKPTSPVLEWPNTAAAEQLFPAAVAGQAADLTVRVRASGGARFAASVCVLYLPV